MAGVRENEAGRVSLLGTRAKTPREAFLRFGHFMHWQLYLLENELLEQSPSSPRDVFNRLCDATLKELPRAEHRLVAEFITMLTDGTHTFAEACAVWKESENDTHRISWNKPDEFLRFLLDVRDRIDPHAWPASQPRFKGEGRRDP